MSKSDYVKKQPQFRKHKCHWPGCDKEVPPAMWGCSYHWFKIPIKARRAIWKNYRPRQEIDLKPSKEYLDVTIKVERWIVKNYKPDGEKR